MSVKDKTRKLEPFWFDGGPLPIRLCYTPTPEAWKIAIEQMGLSVENEPYPENSGRCTVFDGIKWPELTAIVVINRRKGVSNVQVAGLIAHEATHVAQQLARKMFPYDDAARLDSETEAYLVHWATQNIFSAYMEHGK